MVTQKSKATKLETIYGKYSNIVKYEYRGHKYEVEYSNSMDYCVASAHIQHRDAQEKIDKLIESSENNNQKAEYLTQDVINKILDDAFC